MTFQRLTRDDLTTFFKSRSSRVRGSLFDVSFQPHGGHAPKVACIVSKKVMSRAIDRNKTRRRVYAVVRHLSLPRIPLSLVFTARVEAKKAPFAAIALDVRTLVENVLTRYNTRI